MVQDAHIRPATGCFHRVRRDSAAVPSDVVKIAPAEAVFFMHVTADKKVEEMLVAVVSSPHVRGIVRSNQILPAHEECVDGGGIAVQQNPGIVSASLHHGDEPRRPHRIVGNVGVCGAEIPSVEFRKERLKGTADASVRVQKQSLLVRRSPKGKYFLLVWVFA